jgi:glycine cleavage system aminomethyltransferase T
VTSGTFSPILKRGICLGLIEYQCVDFNEFQIEIRKKYEDAEKVKYPFIR